MTVSEKASHLLGFRPLPVIALTILTYLAILISLFLTDRLDDVPSVAKQQKQGLNLDQAWKDLRKITIHPHPYNSHPNDAVHTYLLSRLLPIARRYPHVHLVDDRMSNGSWAKAAATGGYSTYFEGTNILVKIDAPEDDSRTTPNADGVLFSAHYDSVSTAPGATDDGMGVATLLQLVRYFAEKPREGDNQMKRTVVFNINNGEEDWLNGAHAFLEHPWSNLTNTFLNLEGAAAGGRPILFRATSMTPVRAFRSHKLVPHPHANVLSADAFARGLVRSGTDYSVYTGPRLGMGNPNDTKDDGGMQGLDLAFYKGRNRYHTKYDAVPYTDGGKRSLWAMMEVARGVAEGLVCGKVLDGNINTNQAVYFDLFRRVLIVFPLANLLTFNVVFLVVPPVVLLLLIVCEKVFAGHDDKSDDQDDDHPGHSIHPQGPLQTRRQVHPHLRYFGRSSATAATSSAGYGTRQQERDAHRSEESNPSWGSRLWLHLKFWVALVITIGLLVLLTWGYIVINPFAIYASPYLVLSSFLSLSYLSFVYFLGIPSTVPFISTSHTFSAVHQKHTIIHNLYIFTWGLLVLATLGITTLHPGVGGGYFISAWNACLAGACILAALEVLLRGCGGHGDYEELEGEEEEVAGYLPNPHDHTERTPLVHRHHHHHREGHEECTLETWWWIPQFVLSVPLPIILIGNVAMLVLDSTPQTLADGAKASTVYAMIALQALFLVLPLTPFSPALSPSRPHARLFTILVLAVFLFTTLYTWIAFPFATGDELKIYFQQRVELSQNNVAVHANLDTSQVRTLQLTTSLTGPKRFLRSTIIPKIPSAVAAIHRAERLGQDEEGVQCYDEPAKLGLTTCEWESGSGMRPLPGAPTPDALSPNATTTAPWRDGEYFRYTTVRTDKNAVRVKVKGRNTRACRVYLDSHAIKDYSVFAKPVPKLSGDLSNDLSVDGNGKGLQYGYEIGEEGVKEIRLWSREWEREWVVDMELLPNFQTNGATLALAPSQEVKGRVACEWVEYASGQIDTGPFMSTEDYRLAGVDGHGGGKIPAFEEVLAYLPDWALVSKLGDGLVEVSTAFEV